MIVKISETLTSSRFIGSLANTRSNIRVHYDISNNMYAGTLARHTPRCMLNLPAALQALCLKI